MSDDKKESSRLDHRFSHEWHVAINKHHEPFGKVEHQSWMYEAKDMADEVPRMIMLFAQERKAVLSTLHQQCSRSPVVPIEDNHLNCCLGVECRKCEFLLSIEKAKLSPEQIDTAKAWTCAAHIIRSGGDVAREGFLLTAGDRMFWDNVYSSLASDPPEPPEELLPDDIRTIV